MRRPELVLPDNWAWISLSELLLDVRNGTTTKQSSEPPGVPVSRIETISAGEIDLRRVRYVREAADDVLDRFLLVQGDLLFSHINSDKHLGKTGVYEQRHGNLLHGMNLLRLRLPTDIYLPVLLHWVCDYYRHTGLFVSIAQHAVNQSSINQKKLGKIEVPLAPCSEQQRIVEAIESYFTRLDDAVASLQRVERNLKRYRASVLKAAVEGRLVPTEAELAKQEGRDYEPADVLLARILKERRHRWEQAELAKMQAAGKPPKNDTWKAKYQEPAAPDTTNLPTLPEGWCWTSLGQLKEFSLYGPRFSSDAYTNDGQLVLRTSDISEGGKVNLATAPRISLSAEDFAKYRALVGDLLITRTGSLGTLAVFNDEVDAIPGAYLIQYRIPAPVIVTWYCFHALKSPEGQSFLQRKGAGVGRPNLNAPTIESYPIPLPPFAEQERIHSEIQRLFSLADSAREQSSLALARCVRLRQVILKWAFEGKLADQDPNDEPASVLLERIKAEREKAAPIKSPQRERGKGGSKKAIRA